MTVFDHLRWRGMTPDAWAYAGIMPATALPPEDQITTEPIRWATCAVCPAPAALIVVRVLTFTHLLWATYVAATVVERQLCRHHGDECLAGDGGWEEIAVRREA
jgi:hypothetical protein